MRAVLGDINDWDEEGNGERLTSCVDGDYERAEREDYI